MLSLFTNKKFLYFIHIFIYIFAILGFILTAIFFAVQLGITNEQGIVDLQRNTFTKNNSSNPVTTPGGKAETTPKWVHSEEWAVLHDAIIRDREPIYKASALLDIKPRTLVSIIMVEQMRLFSSDRELFKRVFAPLKVLTSQSQFSWGVVGIKEDTAIQVEQYLQASTSPMYLGKQYEHILDFSTNNIDGERFARITDEHNRYYSYLYASVLIRELEIQWKNSGYDISKKPGVIATLFNIGFSHSKPNANPQTGGAAITLASTTYSFGGLAESFYNSDELLDIFPR